MAKTKKTEEPLEAPAPLAPEETVAPVETVDEAPAPEETEAPEEGAPDKIEVRFKEAFVSLQFGDAWYVYDNTGRRLTSGLTEDDAIRLVRGFGVR